MTMRDRVFLVLGLALCLAAAGILWISEERNRLSREQAQTLAVESQRALWDEVVAGRLNTLSLAEILLRDRLGAALEADGAIGVETAAALDDLAARLDDRFGISGLEIHDGQDRDRVLYRAQLGGGGAAILDEAARSLVIEGERSREGILQDETRDYTLFRAFPMAAGAGAGTGVGGEVGGQNGAAIGDRLVVAMASPLSEAVARFAANAGERSLLVDMRGRPVAGEGSNFWDSLPDDLVLGSRDVAVLTQNGETLRLISNPVTDHAGRVLAQLISASTIDQLRLREQRANQITLIAVVLLIGGLIVGLRWYLTTVFSPLEQGLAAMDDLARGDTGFVLPDVDSEDESGRLTRGLETLRQRAMMLVTLRIARDKQRRRQQRFIRSQMQSLAGMLEDEARSSVLSDLDALEAKERDRRPGDGESALTQRHDMPDADPVRPYEPAPDDFGLLADAFDNMAGRVRDQYQRLDNLVAELREALRTKTEYIALQQELDIARQMQLSILPAAFPERPDVAIYGSMLPAKEVGGDFYDFFTIDEDRIGVVVADVCGKGVPAAFFMAISRTLMRATALHGEGPAAVLSRLNDMLAAENEQMMFVTLFYGVFEPATGRLTYANGGHNPPMHVRPDGTVTPLAGTDGMGLAIMADVPFGQAHIDLAPGDWVFLYTDGVTEAFDIDDEAFEEPRLMEVLSGLAGAPISTINPSVFSAVETFARGAPQFDDITCLVLANRPALVHGDRIHVEPAVPPSN